MPREKQNTHTTGSGMQEKFLPHTPQALQSGRLLRCVPVLSAGVLVFLGLVMLGGLTGLLWHFQTYGETHWWVKLNPSVFGPAVDWCVWAVAFLVTVSPSFVMLAAKRTRPEVLVLLTSLVLPLLSVVTMTWSYYVGGTLLICSGFLAAYTLVSRSETLLGLEFDFVARLVWIEVFTLLTLIAAGGIISIVLGRSSAVLALVPGNKVVMTDPWNGILAVDLGVFFLARPLLAGASICLVVVAFLAMFREPFHRIVTLLSKRMLRHERSIHDGARQVSSPRSSSSSLRDVLLPYGVLVASIALGSAMAFYPYVDGFFGYFGYDSWFYLESLLSMSKAEDAIRFSSTGRGLFLALLFFIKSATGLSAESVVKLMPALLSCLLATSGFALVNEGTGQRWVAAMAAVLAVLSPQTALGASAGIISNWFALSIANFSFALILRWIRLRSKLAAAGSLALLLALLGFYASLWVVAVTELAVILVASMIISRNVDRQQWRHEVGILGSVLLGSIALPAVILLMLPFLGPGLGGLDPWYWLMEGWRYVQTVDPELLGSALRLFEEAFFFGSNMIDLPFLLLLSILGLIDSRSRTSCFIKMVSASIFVPAMLMIIISSSSISPYSSYLVTWRGLYLMPLYMTGALGVESVIRRVSRDELPWSSRTQLALGGAFACYVILSSLGFSLRARELALMIGGG